MSPCACFCYVSTHTVQCIMCLSAARSVHTDMLVRAFVCACVCVPVSFLSSCRKACGIVVWPGKTVVGRPVVGRPACAYTFSCAYTYACAYMYIISIYIYYITCMYTYMHTQTHIYIQIYIYIYIYMHILMRNCIHAYIQYTHIQDITGTCLSSCLPAAHPQTVHA
jgi:hypothetical protein